MSHEPLKIIVAVEGWYGEEMRRKQLYFKLCALHLPRITAYWLARNCPISLLRKITTFNRELT